MLKAGLDPQSSPSGLTAERFRTESFGAPWRATSPADIAPVTIDEARALH